MHLKCLVLLVNFLQVFELVGYFHLKGLLSVLGSGNVIVQGSNKRLHRVALHYSIRTKHAAGD